MKTWMMIKSSIRKNKSSSITLVLLITMATILLYSSLMVLLNVSDVIENVNANNQGADFRVFVSNETSEDVEELMKSVSGYDGSEIEDAIVNYGTVQDKKVEDTPQNEGIVLLNQETARTMSKIDRLEDAKEMEDNGILVPYSLKSIFDYQSGDEIEIGLNGKKETFKICGFLQDVMFSTPSNVDRYIFYVTDATFKRLYHEVPDTMKMKDIKVRLEKNASSSDYSDEFINKVSTTKGISSKNMTTLDYETMKLGTSITIMIVTIILIVFSMLMLMIALIVIRFTIINHIEEDVKNIGAMEAAGFTSTMIRKSLILQFIWLGVVGFVIGFAVALSISNVVTTFVSSSIGLYWEAEFSISATLLTIGIILLFVGAIATKVSARLKKITPIVALRNGLSTYNFKKNYLPLDSTRGKLNFLLGVKQMLHAKKQNISIGLIGVIMSFTFIMGFTLLMNFSGKGATLMKLVGLEQSEIGITCTSKEARDELRQTLSTYNEIENTNLFCYEDIVISAKGKDVSTSANICEDFSNINVKTVFDGRYPIHDNEIVLSNSNAEKLGVSTGDVVSVRGKEGNKEYVVVGINQHINHLGRSCSLTEKGMIRNDSTYYCDEIYVYLKDGIEIESFMNRLEQELGTDEFSFVNMQATFESSLKSISDICNIMCIVLDGVVILVVALILFYMVKVKIVRDKKILGIQKAIGFTTKQLMVHNVISFCIIMFISFIIGAIGVMLFSTPICTLMFSVASFKKCSLDVSLMSAVLSVIGLTIFSILITMILSIRIKKVNPRELFMD